MSHAPHLEVRDLRKSFGGTQALRGVSLAFRAGQVHALLGENGAGKSTLVGIIAGSVKPDYGEVYLRGRPQVHSGPGSALRAGIATIHQHKALVPNLTVLENVQLGYEPRVGGGILSRRARGAAVGAIERVRLSHLRGTRVSEIGAAERQLVTVARAISREASVVIFDEPSAELAHGETKPLFGVVDDLRRDGYVVIYITHRLEEVDSLADHVSVLRDGSLIASGRRERYDRSTIIEAMIGTSLDERAPARRVPVQKQGSALEVRSLNDRLGRFKNISVTADRGEIIAILGLGNSGAVELTETLAGIHRPASGSVLVQGRPVRLTSPRATLRRGIAYLPRERASRAVLGQMSVADTVTIGSLRHVTRAGVIYRGADRGLACRELARVGVSAGAERGPLSSLSGGNQQRALFARALATGPRVLVAEDPTAGVDVAGRSQIHRLIAKLAESGVTVVLSTAELGEVVALADRAIVMRNGRITADLGRSELTETRLMYAQFGEH